MKALAPPRHDLVTVLEAGIFNIATLSSADRTRGSVATVAYLPWLSGALAPDDPSDPPLPVASLRAWASGSAYSGLIAKALVRPSGRDKSGNRVKKRT